jgi:iron complex transport system substrate-binding protein
MARVSEVAEPVSCRDLTGGQRWPSKRPGTAAGAARRWLVAGILGVALVLDAGAAEKFRDDRGVVVELPAVSQRIVSLLPSITESICAMGGCGRLVGTDRFSNWPAGVAALPKLGGLDDPQIERIAALKPDVVLVSASERLIDRLEVLGLKVIVLESRNHADLRRTLTLVGRMLGVPSAADKVWADIERQTAAAAERVPKGLRGKRVYFEVDSTPYAAGTSSFIGETLAQLGLANAISAELGPFPKVNPEYVVRIQPDIIIAVNQGLAEMPQRPGWQSLQALRRRQTCGFSSQQYDILTRPGPRTGEAADLLASCLVGLQGPG